jgi:hypothetical protein
MMSRNEPLALLIPSFLIAVGDTLVILAEGLIAVVGAKFHFQGF